MDDYPYGGGPGMVLRPEPVFDAVRAISAMDSRSPRIVIMSPRGTRFDQKTAERYSLMERILLVCGRYEGFDERVYSLADEVVSVGDYVLTGGEIPALCVIDATVRLLPGALGDEDSAALESFTTGLLEHPQFTRPSVFEDMQVPEVLLSGDHARIERWRREQAVLMTVRHRPDLIETTSMSDADLAVVEGFERKRDAK
ncbi:MAG: tRNA (guanosine(37)-N1)-methyltransferase TrmD [Actinobacteria bacterium]|nr:tRNA (guanosine(37)-N1)-methyltransferase TrmD [Actinomycetota bacterium]